MPEVKIPDSLKQLLVKTDTTTIWRDGSVIKNGVVKPSIAPIYD